MRLKIKKEPEIGDERGIKQPSFLAKITLLFWQYIVLT